MLSAVEGWLTVKEEAAQKATFELVLPTLVHVFKVENVGKVQER